LERSRRNKGIYRRGSERNSGTTRERLETRRKGVTLEKEDICS